MQTFALKRHFVFCGWVDTKKNSTPYFSNINITLFSHMTQPDSLREVISNFKVNVDIGSVRPFGNGHINDTFLLNDLDNSGQPGYLLQKVNHHIFKDIEGLMSNISLVTNHLREQYKVMDYVNPEERVLRLVPAYNGIYYYKDQEGAFWRIYHYLKGTNSYDIVSTEKQAYEGGKAFGNFQATLADLNAELLVATIPDFLNMEKRLQAFEAAVVADSEGRVEEVEAQIKFVRDRAAAMCYFQFPENIANIPLRVTHNDTKFNNILLDQQDEAQCVIDLDTVMPGYIAYDFGDAIRSIINTAAEDEADLSKINLNIPLFRAYTDGYFYEAGDFITPEEIDSLMVGVLLLPYMQAVRFLTDYLDGDHYYKIHFEGHNLQRTNAQIQLVLKLEEHQHELAAIIDEEKSNLYTKTQN